MNAKSKALKLLLFALGIHFASLVHAHDNGELEKSGKAMREELISVFQEKQKKNAMRIVDLTELCVKFPLAGRSVHDVNKILTAAGQRFEIQPVKEANAPEGQFFGGFVLEKALFYGAVFNIKLHVDQTDRKKKVDRIVSCNVLVSSL